MKKRRNTAAAILLSSVMAVSACAMTMTPMSAFAGSIEINREADTGNAYKAYQILKGTVTADDTLSLISFGDDLTGGITSELVTALKAVNSTAFASLSTDTTPTEFATMIGNLPDDTAKQNFAKVIGKYVSGGTAVSTDETTVVDGYYVVKEEGNGSPKTLNLLKVAGDDITLSVKEDSPSSVKTVSDVNDSKTQTESSTKTADYDIGDDVPYTLTFTLPSDYAIYEKYPVTILDDMCAGLSLNADSVKIWYGDTDTSTGGTAITFTEDSSASDSFTNPTGGTIYKYVIPDLKTQTGATSMTAGQTITIKYTAKLTGDAVVIGTPGNPNNYTVKYASDPNWTATPGPGEGTPSEPPTDTTPESKNVVFTYQLTVDKVDDDGNTLAGANFAVYKWTDKAGTADVDAASGWTIVNEITATDVSTFEFKGLDDGIYKLVETRTPTAAYNQIDPIMFEISAIHTDADYSLGTVTFNGLTGATVSNGNATVSITNNKGVTLPETGGIGTTIFYVVGGTLIVGAIILFITKKRMKSTEE